jgi:O-glycosyl hydrolase
MKYNIIVFTLFCFLVLQLTSYAQGSQLTDISKSSTQTQASAINLDVTQTRQTVDGFGAGMKRNTKDLYTLNNPLVNQSSIDSIREVVIAKCFNELEVNMMRFFVYSDLEPTNDNTDPFLLNPAALDWGRYESNSSKYKSQYTAQAVNDAVLASNIGFDYIIGNCNSAPAYLKTNGLYTNGGSLITGGQEEYSEFLTAFIKGLKSKYNINVTHISPSNESDYNVSYESMNATPAELQLIIKNLHQRLQTESLSSIKIISPECYRVTNPSLTAKNGTSYYIANMFADVNTKSAVDVIGTHTYADSDNTADWGALASVSSNKPVWVTESSVLKDPDNTMTNANTMIKWILRGFNLGGMTAYMYHLFYEPGAANDTCSALVKFSAVDGVTLPKRYFAFKQFTNFVKPGFKRLAADCAANANIIGTAFISADGNRIILQLLNEGNAASVPINIPSNIASVEHYITSNSSLNNCKPMTDIVFAKGNTTMSVSLPINSFHTIVLNTSNYTILADDIALKNELKLYPNPAKNYTDLTFPVLQCDAKLTIYNTLGTIVMEFDLRKGIEQLKIDMTELNSGTYFINLSAEKRYCTKIIKN